MTTTTIRNGSACSALRRLPSTNFPATLTMYTEASYAMAYLYESLAGIPKGADIGSAVLRLRQVGPAPGTNTIVVQLLTEAFKAAELTWNNGRPAATTANQVTYTRVNPGSGAGWDFDITDQVQSIANGQRFFGWRILCSAGTVRFGSFGMAAVNGLSFQPTLFLEYSLAPPVPTSLHPTGEVGTNKPLCSWDFTDVTGSNPLVGVQVQVDEDADEVSPAFDSGLVTAYAPELALASTAYAGATAAVPTQWRARSKTSSGVWSAWSDWASFTYTPVMAVDLTYPAADPDDYVLSPMALSAWAVGGTQTAFSVALYRNDRLIVPPKRTPSTDLAFPFPEGFIISETPIYRMELRVWDDVPRAGLPGFPPYVRISRAFLYTPSGTQPIDSLTATQPDAAPVTLLTWTRAFGDATFFGVKRDGLIIKTGIDGSDRTYEDWTAGEGSHVYEVFPDDDGVVSGDNPTATINLRAVGLWLMCKEEDVKAVVFADSPAAVTGTLEYVEDAESVVNMGAASSTRIVSGLRGGANSVGGLLVNAIGAQASDSYDALWHLKTRPGAICRIVTGELNAPVTVANIAVSPVAGYSNRTTPVYAASFTYESDGTELPWEPLL